MGLNHARTIATGPQTTLAVVIDPVEANGRAAAEQYGALWAPRLDALDGVDAAVVAAPTEHHKDLALQVIAAGLPLLVEKPVCPSLVDTEEVVAASAAAGTPLMCGLLERFNPAVMVAMAMIEEPRYVRAERHSPYAPRIKTGVAWDLLVHDVDLVIRAFGGGTRSRSTSRWASSARSRAGRRGRRRGHHALHGGGIASASASRIGQRKVRSMVIHELDRMIEVDLLRRASRPTGTPPSRATPVTPVSVR